MGLRLGFVINPIAGMGGRVGLKGTDGVVEQARTRGAQPVAQARALQMLRELSRLLAEEAPATRPSWMTAGTTMGAQALRTAGIDAEVVHEPGADTRAADTRAAVERFLERGVDLVVFCGGDGTARDVCALTGETTPILGVPAGVKMYSGVFGATPALTARILLRHLRGELTLRTADVADLDEEAYREGRFRVRRHHRALVPHEPSYTQSSKVLIDEAGDADARAEIGQRLAAELRAQPHTLFLLGPGSTVATVAEALGLDKTLLGVDAVLDAQLLARDLDERALHHLLDQHHNARLILSPIGAQGFVLGRGNLQLSPDVVRRIGTANLIIIATRQKLARTPRLRFDTGDPALDAELAGEGYLRVRVGEHLRMVPVIAAR